MILTMAAVYSDAQKNTKVPFEKRGSGREDQKNGERTPGVGFASDAVVAADSTKHSFRPDGKKPDVARERHGEICRH
jgi:hypothetical protein